MKKFLSALLILTLILSFAACGNSKEPEAVQTPAPTQEPVQTPEPTVAPEEVELVVFAAASMTETMDQIIELYKDVAPNVTIVPTYDSSGTLKTQIQEGAYCDLFISAAQKQMNQIDSSKNADSGNTEGLDFVLQGTRMNLLENKVVLAVPDDNKADIKSFEDLATDKLTLLCIGNEDVPVGAYSLEIINWLGAMDSLTAEGKLTYGSNVKEVTTQVKEGTVDAGIIYATDAYSAKLTVVSEATTEMCKQVIYPAAVLNITEHEQEAKDFLTFLQSDAAMTVFKSVGFAPAK